MGPEPDPGAPRAARERTFRAVAACPACGGRLAEVAGTWRCGGCGGAYARGRSAFFVAGSLDPEKQVRYKLRPAPGWKRALRAPSLSYNSRGDALRRLVREDPGPVVDLGSGDRRLHPRALNLDLAEYAEVDVVYSGARLPLADGSVSLVICQAVLEHVPDPSALVGEIRRVLRPGGRCYIEVPFLQAYHADPDDYQRFTHQGLRRLCRELEMLEEGCCVGPWSALAWQLREVALVPLRPGRLRVAVQHALGWLLAPVSRLDRLYQRFPGAVGAAAGVYALVRRPAEGAAAGSAPSRSGEGTTS